MVLCVYFPLLGHNRAISNSLNFSFVVAVFLYTAPNSPIASAKRPRKDSLGSRGRNAVEAKAKAAAAVASKSAVVQKASQKQALFSPFGKPVKGDGQDEDEDIQVTATVGSPNPRGNKLKEADSKLQSSNTFNRGRADSYDETMEDNMHSSASCSSQEYKYANSNNRIERDEEVSKYNASQSQEGNSSSIDEKTSAAESQAVVEEEDDNDDDDDELFNPYLFIAGLPPVTGIQRNNVLLPGAESSTLPTLVLDLDETLVHCTVEPIDNADMVFPVTFNNTLYNVYVRKRPYLDYFLEAVSRSYEVIVFTASQQVYADVLLDLLDPEKKYIRHRLFRESCVMVQGNYLKDLHVVNRDYHRMVLVDNSPHAYGFQVDNGIPIESWFDDDSDTELLKLVGFLRKVYEGNDVRPVVREQFKTFDLVSKARRGESVHPFLTRAPPF